MIRFIMGGFVVSVFSLISDIFKPKTFAADCAGAAMASTGLIAFAIFVWKLLPDYNLPAVITGATLLWALVSAVVWWLWKRNAPHRLANAVRSLKTVSNPGKR